MDTRRGLTASLFVLLVAAMTACSGASEKLAPTGGKAAAPPEAQPAEESLSEEPAQVGEPGLGAAGGELPVIGPKVIKTASVRVEVARGGFSDALGEATAVAGKYGGFVLSSALEGEKARRGSLVIRVPAERFELALADIRELGTLKRERVSGEDVGQEFIDLEARLRNLRAHEGVMLRLYDRAQTIPESIRVQKEVTSVQLRIEEIEGRLRYLRDQAAFGTISIGLVEVGVVPDGPKGVIERSWERAVDVVLALVSFAIVSLGFIVPIGILGLLLLPFVRRLRARTTG
jgi:Domain of unknown function (DUF4349)